MHIHLDAATGLAVFAYVLLFGTLFRLAAAKLKDTAFGQAMAFMY